MDKPTAIGVYIFAGGFSVGMTEHVDLQAHFEDGEFGVDTFKANFPRVPVYTDPAEWPMEKARKVDIIYGNPHCSPWSPVGRSMFHGRENWRTDPNTAYARNLLRLGLEVKPKVWVMESVPNIQRSEFLTDMARLWVNEGYAFTVAREDAKFLGLPQQRRRCFMVAHQIEVPWKKPDFQFPVVAGEALEVNPGPYYETDGVRRELLATMGPGEPMRKAWLAKYGDGPALDSQGKTAGRPLIMEHRINPRRPSGTVIGMSCYYHPTQPRLLGVGELAALCGYPEDYKWRGTTIADMVAQVAKAVTPPAARWLGEQLSSAFALNKSAEPQFQKYTCWAQSPRIDDWRMLDDLETFEIPAPSEPITADDLVGAAA